MQKLPIDLMPDAVLMVASSGEIVGANARVTKLLGYAVNELLGRSMEILVPDAARGHHGALRSTWFEAPYVRSMGVARRIDGQHKDGRLVPLDIMLGPLEDSGVAVAILRDISHLRQLQDQLAAKNVELEELNERKNRFLGMAAHDLRSPLTVIDGYAGLLGTGKLGEVTKEQVQYLRRISKSARFMRGLVDELLDISAIEAGSLVLHRQPEDLERLVQEALGIQRMIADHKSIIIKLSATGSLPPLVLDASKVEQVVHNLVSNAVKYSESGTTVRVTISEGDGVARLVVLDEGQGIPESELEHVFEPFRRTSSKPTGGETSTGLGLAIARRIVTAHGGTLVATSEQGRGSEFTMTLPMR